MGYGVVQSRDNLQSSILATGKYLHLVNACITIRITNGYITLYRFIAQPMQHKLKCHSDATLVILVGEQEAS